MIARLGTDTIIDPATRWRGEAINPYSTDVDRKAGCSSECHRLENIINQIIRVIHGNLIAGICPALIIADRKTSGDAIRTINGKVPEDGTMPQEFWAAYCWMVVPVTALGATAVPKQLWLRPNW